MFANLEVGAVADKNGAVFIFKKRKSAEMRLVQKRD